jgi:hypothetical protein
MTEASSNPFASLCPEGMSLWVGALCPAYVEGNTGLPLRNTWEGICEVQEPAEDQDIFTLSQSLLNYLTTGAHVIVA